MKHFFFFLTLICTLSSCYRESTHPESTAKESSKNQSDIEYDSSIYLGLITGSIKDTFVKNYSPWKDSIFKLSTLANSSKPIEIRFFTTNYWSSTSFCIILEYDSAFRMHGFKNDGTYLEHVKIEANPDSLFDKLVVNGIFSINTPDLEDVYPVLSPEDFLNREKNKKQTNNYPIYELTKNGFKEGTIVGPVMDGVSFLISYKVDTLFDNIYIGNPATYFKHNPDFQLARRKFEIVTLFLSALE